MRGSLAVVLWAAFAAIVVAGAILLLRACGLLVPVFGWSFCPATPPAMEAEAERGASLRKLISQLELELAQKNLACAGIPPPPPPPLELPTEAGPPRPQQTAQLKPPPPPPPPKPQPPLAPPAGQLPCNATSNSGGQGVTRNIYFLGDRPGTVAIAYDMYRQPDALTVVYRGAVVATTGGARSGRGRLSFNWQPVAPDFSVEVIVIGQEAGTTWTYTLFCPS